MPNKKLQQFVTKASEFIIRAQNADGSFSSLSSENTNLKNPETFVTIFYTSLILSSLSEDNLPELKPVKQRLVHFLLNEQSEVGSFNYWTKNFSKFKDEACPDDLDDTSCAWSAIFSHDSNLIDAKILSKLTKLLVNLEENEGGPYQTWVLPQVKKTKWADVDLAVNANIGYLLSLLDISLPSLQSLAEKAINLQKFSSSYYPENSVLYFLSRFYQGGLQAKLIAYLIKKNKCFNNALECVLIGLSLLNLNADYKSVEPNIDYLLSNQNADGSLDPGVFINERTFKTKKRFSGCRALTTAFGIMLVDLYRKRSSLATDDREDNGSEFLKKRVVAYTATISKAIFKGYLDNAFSRFLQKMTASDYDNQIILHPFLFFEALMPKQHLDENFLFNLCVGSIFGWTSYTIFDNITDEIKDLDKISLAIICNRELEDFYCDDNADFKPCFKQIMNRVDVANFYETNFAKLDLFLENRQKIYPSPQFVAEKSIAHALGPLAVLYKLGFKENSKEFKKLLSFYIHYLTARQLNDDAHDWSEDLTRGQINYVGEMVLERFLVEKSDQIDIKRDLTLLQKFFWQDTIIEVCHIIQREISQARKLLAEIDIVNDNYLALKLDELESSTQKALKERERTIQYIEHLFASEIKKNS